uniref:Alpha-1,3-glucosyltransferase n=1 Tax=Blastobotrys adeninivorans TaxID=409370 RepID=A0A060T3M7_BLAAD
MSSPRPGTPKKKKKAQSEKSPKSLNKIPKITSAPTPLRDTPLGGFLSPFTPSYIQWVARYVVLCFAVILRCAIGLGPYSGFQSEPMHGDFEAQRHWMEITIHLPMSKWYFYDLQWWGLDYPPLTAYHSWFLGKIGSFFNPQWFALDTSRALDDPDLKSYMRATVIASELAIYIPGVIWYVRWYGKNLGLSSIDQSIATAAVLLQPALMLVDHGHFQYNSVMLGLTLMAIVNLSTSPHRRLLASVLFVSAILFKQMALYYAPAIFAYLLGVCVFPSINILRLISIGLVVIASFAIALLPFFYSGGLDQLIQIAIRVFPFERGLWEDKVANIWCTVNTFVKLREIFSLSQLQQLALGATLAAIAPTMGLIFYYPRRHLLPWAFSAIAWAFFLFSFQVHEKSVLVPLMPATMLLASSDPNTVALVTWINNVASFSLWPLLRREGLGLQYAIMVFCWNWLLGNLSPSRISTILPKPLFWKLVVVGSYAAMILLHIGQEYVPAQYYIYRFPDIWVLGNVTLCTGCFGLFWLWTNYKLYTLR